MNELALFAGAGGGILGGHLLGWRTVVAVERDAYAAQVLAQRQNDGILEAFPIWSDVTTFDGKPWRGLVDVISAGFPCQDASVANTKGRGIEGSRTGMGWRETKRIISEVEPDFVWLENSPMLTIRGFGTVLGDLAAIGFDAHWGVLSATGVGAPPILEKEFGSLLPTPTATDYKGGRSQSHRKDGTPTTSEFRHWCRVLHGLTYPIPMHMEAMMGWPIGWTALEPLAMGKFLEWRQQHSSCFFQDLNLPGHNIKDAA